MISPPASTRAPNASKVIACAVNCTVIGKPVHDAAKRVPRPGSKAFDVRWSLLLLPFALFEQADEGGDAQSRAVPLEELPLLPPFDGVLARTKPSAHAKLVCTKDADLAPGKRIG